MARIFRNYLSQAQLAECEQVATLLTPEMENAVYILNLPTSHPPTPSARAFTTRGRFSYAIYEALQAAGMYRGQWPAIVFSRRLSRDWMLGTLLHEIAHVLPWSEPITATLPTTEQREAWDGFVAARFTRGYVGDSRTLPNWFSSHGAQFIRMALHLHARAWHHGLEIGLPELSLAGPFYDLSPAYQYMHAIGDEPKRMLGCEFAEIDAAPMPVEFVSLFAHDFESWCSRQWEREPIVTKKEETENVRVA